MTKPAYARVSTWVPVAAYESVSVRRQTRQRRTGALLCALRLGHPHPTDLHPTACPSGRASSHTPSRVPSRSAADTAHHAYTTDQAHLSSANITIGHSARAVFRCCQCGHTDIRCLDTDSLAGDSLTRVDRAGLGSRAHQTERRPVIGVAGRDSLVDGACRTLQTAAIIASAGLWRCS